MIGQIPNVVKQKVGSTVYYFGTLTSDKVKSLTFVPVIEPSRTTFLSEQTENGYQRPASPARMRAFMRFLKDHPNHVVPPVLLSARSAWTFKEGHGNGSVGRLEIEGPAAIVDGQHRLGGFVALFESTNGQDVRDVSFIVLEGLSVKEESETFRIVNNSQKGVPKSLTEFLGESDEAQIAWSLNLESDSPFKGRITRTTMAREHLFALHSVARQIKRLFSVGGLQDLDVPNKVEYTIRFWTIIADRLPTEWSDIEKLDDADSKGRQDFKYKLLELTGFIAWSAVGSHIFARSYSEATGMNWDNVKRLVDAAAAIDWDKDGQYAGRTGEAGGKVLADDMLRLLPAEAAQPGE